MPYLGKTYYKIPVDVNEGVGGNWIYLYYAKIAAPGGALSDLSTINKAGDYSFDAIQKGWTSIGWDRFHNWANLNEGCGGGCVKLIARRWYMYSEKGAI